MSAAIKLYHYWRSSCSWRLRWGLNLKQIPYQLVPVHLLKAEHKTPNYLQLNPAGTVPTLVQNKLVIADSLAALEWLEETHPVQALWPQDAETKAFARQLAMTIAAGTQPIQNLKVQEYISQNPQQRQDFARHWISQGLATYETLLQKGPGGSFSIGAMPSIADLCLIPQCYNAQRFGVNLGLYPTVERIYNHALNTKPCADAHPDQFKKDFP